jgi:hypothetical protein
MSEDVSRNDRTAKQQYEDKIITYSTNPKNKEFHTVHYHTRKCLGKWVVFKTLILRVLILRSKIWGKFF